MCLLLWSAAGHTVKGTTLLSWSWEAYSLTWFIWILHTGEQYSGLSHSIMSCNSVLLYGLTCKIGHSRNLSSTNYTPSGGEFEKCTVRSWAQNMRYNETGIGILLEESQSLQYFTPYMFMAHTHGSVVSWLNISAGFGRNSPRPLWCLSLLPRPETAKLSQWTTEFVHWPDTGVSIWVWTGSAIIWRSMTSRLWVLLYPML